MEVDASQEELEVGERRITMVAVQAGERVTPGKAGRTIWCWVGEDDAEKRVLEVRPRLQANAFSRPGGGY